MKKKRKCLPFNRGMQKMLRMLSLKVLLLSLCIMPGLKLFSQDTTFTLKMINVSLETVMQHIKNSSDYHFLYKNSDIETVKNLNIEVSNASVEEVLTHCLQGSGLSFSVDDNIILIKKAEISPKTKEPVKTVVKGKVTDEEGLPLPGATVLIKGTYKGMTTDKDGNYAIKVPGNQTILTFSFVGFTSREIRVGEQTTINVTLEQAATELEEVTINAGYYTVKEREKTGNISRVAAKEIEKQPVTNPLQALQGRMPGVRIEQTTGIPGGGFNIRIRGQNSLRRNNFTGDNGNLPFYVVDGVPYPAQPLSTGIYGQKILNFGNPLNSINPADIESIEILKDADATAIYGSRGANGVVLITTKKASVVGKTRVEVNFSQGIGQVVNMLELLNTEQYLEMRHEAFSNDGMTPDPSNPSHFDVTKFGDNTDTDWQEELIGGTATVTNAQLNISGGNAYTRFSFAPSYYRETTVFPGDFAYQRGSGRFNVSHSTKDRKFNIALNVNFLTDKNNLPPYDPTSIALSLAPNHPALLDEEGNLAWVEGDFGDRNPLAELSRTFIRKTNNLITNTDLSYELGPGIKLKTRLGYNKLQLEETEASPSFASNPVYNRTSGHATFINANTHSWIIEPQLEYTKDVFNGRLSVLIGSTFQESIFEREVTGAQGFPDDNSLENIKAAERIFASEYVNTQYRYSALYGRIGYNWKEKYIINLTGRRDGSSRFGADKQFGNFGAIGLAWIFSNEAFIKQALPFISFGKLRGSYGSTGSDQIGNYQYLDAYQYTGKSYLGVPGIRPARLANPDYSWETNKKLEIGMALGFFNDRILTEVSYYRNRSSSQLVNQPLSSVTGFSGILVNFPATVENTGWEFELNTINVQGKDFSWTSSFNLTIPKNELVEFPGIENTSFVNTYEVGKSLFTRAVFQNVRVNPETGLYTVDDMNDDGQITFGTGEDRLSTKEITEAFFGGLQNNIRYKGFELSFLFQFVRQTGVGYLTFFNIPGFNSNQPVEVLKRWQKSGDISSVQRFTQTYGPAYRPAFYARLGDNGWVVNASFIRLKNVSLAWNLPQKWAKRAGFENIRLYIQGQNLLTITNYIGLDPETQSTGLPPLRMLTSGVQLTF